MLSINLSPSPIFETERLIIKRFENKDAHDMFAFRSNIESMKYIGKPLQISVDESYKAIEMMNELINTNAGINWGIYLKSEQKIIGAVSIHKIDKVHHRGEIGYMLHPIYWKKGIITEAITQVLEYGFQKLNLHSIEALIDPRNEATIAVLRKFNFIQEAHFKENYYFNEEFIDTSIYSLLKSNFVNKKTTLLKVENSITKT